MRSRTKIKLDDETLGRMFSSAGINNAGNFSPLGAGEFNAVYSAEADGRKYAVKIAPPPGAPILAYEEGMMQAELAWYEQIRENTSIRVPRIYHADFGKRIIPSDWFIMERLEGVQMDKFPMSSKERLGCTGELAKMAAQIHGIRGSGFGYLQSGLHSDWYLAISAMTLSLLSDGRKKGHRGRRGERLLGYIEKHRGILEKAEADMVNFDIYKPNIICRRTADGIEYAWIDPERSFWGDRIADFVCLEPSKPLCGKKRSLDAYNELNPYPIGCGKEENIRYAIALGYLGFLMETEKYFRYTPLHFGWWRNIAASKYFLSSAFKILKTEG